jgi:hypothetical protein
MAVVAAAILEVVASRSFKKFTLLGGYLSKNKEAPNLAFETNFLLFFLIKGNFVIKSTFRKGYF